MTDEIRVVAETYDSVTPLESGEPGFHLTGLREVQGTFEGILQSDLWAERSDDPVNIYFYGPDPKTPRWRHWFYRIREYLFVGSRWFPEYPYPTVVLASGPARLDFAEHAEDDGTITVTGSFTKAGTWTFDDWHDKEVNP